MGKNGQDFTMVKIAQLVKNCQNGQKCQIYKVQSRNWQKNSSIRLSVGDSMSLTLPS